MQWFLIKSVVLSGCLLKPCLSFFLSSSSEAKCQCSLSLYGISHCMDLLPGLPPPTCVRRCLPLLFLNNQCPRLLPGHPGSASYKHPLWAAVHFFRSWAVRLRIAWTGSKVNGNLIYSHSSLQLVEIRNKFRVKQLTSNLTLVNMAYLVVLSNKDLHICVSAGGAPGHCLKSLSERKHCFKVSHHYTHHPLLLNIAASWNWHTVLCPCIALKGI